MKKYLKIMYEIKEIVILKLISKNFMMNYILFSIIAIF